MSYRVTLKPGDHSFWMEADEFILDAALREQQALPYGCRTGSCGACMGKVLEGTVVYPQDAVPEGLDARQRAAGQALLCQARPASDLVIEVREMAALQDIQVKTLPCRVVTRQLLAPDVMRLYLKIPSTERFEFLAGQYISIIWRNNRRRDFSLANAPHASDLLELHVRLVAGGQFTSYVFEEMKEKAILRFQGPLGRFFPREESLRPIIMMAGGTGFAPLKSMLEHAFHKNLARPVHLYWGARARRDLYLNELPETWSEKYSHFRYTPVLSEPEPEDHWPGRTGWVHEAVAADYPDLSAFDVYMSGPPAMIDSAKAVFRAQGLPEEQLYYDAFEFAPESR